VSRDADPLTISARYRKLACEIRAELRMLRSPEMIEDLNLLADRYDALAEHLEAQNSDNSKVDGRSAAGQRSAED
jgi:ribosomal protein S15P/S13E